jgi:hypothetical protein
MNQNKDKVFETKIFYKENYKVVIIIRFLMHQSIVPKYPWSILY